MQARVSIVIPVYNEADQIYDCLAAIAQQTVQPYEVIIVDNNSTDGTAALAANFSFVRVLCEPRQGVVHARDRGFGAARGDIIGRIDADTIITNNWVETLQRVFEDKAIDVVTGSVRLRNICAPRLASRIDLFWRRYLSDRLGAQVGLQGANMALRRSVWQAVRGDVCHTSGYHEDFDLGLHAYRQGRTGSFYEPLVASVSHRQLDAGFRNFLEYALTSPRTYLAHGHHGGRKMYHVVAFIVAVYPLIVLLSRGYDEHSKRFSARKLFSMTVPARVNPALFVD